MKKTMLIVLLYLTTVMVLSDKKEMIEALDRLRMAKRTKWYLKRFCGVSGDWCGKCCEGYTCKCNLWNTNCRCQQKLFWG